MEQNRKPRDKPRTYGHLMFDKGGKTISLTSGARKTGQPLVKKMKLEDLLTPYTKINSKWIKYLNIRPETIKFLEENIGKTLRHRSQQDPL